MEIALQELETDTFKLCCRQTVTGVKFLIVSDPKQMGVDNLLVCRQNPMSLPQDFISILILLPG